MWDGQTEKLTDMDWIWNRIPDDLHHLYNAALYQYKQFTVVHAELCPQKIKFSPPTSLNYVTQPTNNGCLPARVTGK